MTHLATPPALTEFTAVTALTQADPIGALLAAREEEGVLAVIVGIEGPSYRPLGELMAFLPDGRRVGSLSSGCIEGDLAYHAAEVLLAGQTRKLRYGRGSPFVDIQLPCGGGLDILLIPRPDRTVLAQMAQNRAARRVFAFTADLESGALALAPLGETGAWNGLFRVRHLPEPRFVVFGKGPEAQAFAALTRAADYPTMLLSPDVADCGGYEVSNPDQARVLHRPEFPSDVAVDARTAVVLFFHDHDWEPPILKGALESEAFYIGCQGSLRAHGARLLRLEELGVAQEAADRIHGPIGLIRSTRDPRTLAVSVLAEILGALHEPR